MEDSRISNSVRSNCGTRASSITCTATSTARSRCTRNRSIVCPTAEAYTFRGWAYNFLGRVDDAIGECKKAIEVDPGFGNPYNDIGAYLIAKGELDEAVPWLEQAKRAPRYEPRHFPYMNLGRLYAAKGMLQQAISEFERALELQPGEPTCEAVVARSACDAQLNSARTLAWSGETRREIDERKSDA